MFRHRLHFGPYATPRFRIGQRVEDARRGLVRIVGLSDGRIQWPIGFGPGGLSLVLYRDLARAVKRETAASSSPIAFDAVSAYRFAGKLPQGLRRTCHLTTLGERSSRVAA